MQCLPERPLAPSRGAARKLIQSGGVQLNGSPVDDVEMALSRESALFGRYQLIRRGKKVWHLGGHTSEPNVDFYLQIHWRNHSQK